jgi:hypothetical protein
MSMKLKVVLALLVTVVGTATAETPASDKGVCPANDASRQCAMEVAGIPGATPYEKVVNLYARGKIFNPADVQGYWIGRLFSSGKPSTPYAACLSIGTRPTDSRGPLFCRDFILTVQSNERPNYFDTFGTEQEASIRSTIQSRLDVVKTAVAQGEDVVCDHSGPDYTYVTKARMAGPYVVVLTYYKSGSTSSSSYSYFFKKVSR